MNQLPSEVVEFLHHSNLIEGVWDPRSLSQAVKSWNFISNCLRINKENILKTHQILMRDHLSGNELGKFRTVDVYIGGRKAPAAYLIPVLITEWITQANEAKTEEEIKQAHIRYEWIHPFVDGNGRTGRIFLNFSRIKNNLPILVIEEDKRDKYYDWFR